MFEKIKHFAKSLDVKNKQEKLLLVQLLGVAIYIDQLSRNEEIDIAKSILNGVFPKDFKYLSKELDILLENFNNDIKLYEKSKAEIKAFIKENKRVDLREVIITIFKADNEIAKSEQDYINELELL